MKFIIIALASFALDTHAFSVRPATARLCYPPSPPTTLFDASIIPSPDDDGNCLGDRTLDQMSTDRLAPWKLALTQFNMMAYVASLCVVLPLALSPLWLLRQSKLVDTCRIEDWSLQTAEFCARNMLRIIPSVDVQVISSEEDNRNPEPSIWCANHVSPLDTFLFLATDRDLRGKYKRPLKTVYWKGLEENPVTKLVFSLAGFLPVQMDDNGSGNPNQYDSTSFKQLVRGARKAFEDGFDIFLLPEGQLNPHPETGLLPVFSGAYNLAERGHRPIRLVGVYGTERLWNANDEMIVTDNRVRLRCYPKGRRFDSAQDFSETLHAVLGYYGAHGEDTPQLEQYLYAMATSSSDVDPHEDTTTRN